MGLFFACKHENQFHFLLRKWHKFSRGTSPKENKSKVILFHELSISFQFCLDSFCKTGNTFFRAVCRQKCCKCPCARIRIFVDLRYEKFPTDFVKTTMPMQAGVTLNRLELTTKLTLRSFAARETRFNFQLHCFLSLSEKKS
uniref:Uncharacterized protein n=1 Tax=Cacopsylla melanoneura TaxID=428564 RepID=A0A8D8ZCE7_9HEMI